MSGPSSYFHARVFSLSFHTSMVNMLLTYLMSYFHVRDSRSVFLHLLARWPSFTFSPGVGRKRLPCKPTGFSILTSTVKGPGVLWDSWKNSMRFLWDFCEVPMAVPWYSIEINWKQIENNLKSIDVQLKSIEHQLKVNWNQLESIIFGDFTH